ncbi:MAG: porphobilinogen synthase [Breznakibacter sp.]
MWKGSVSLGIDKILLFGVVGNEVKTSDGTASYADGNLVSRAVSAVKQKFPRLMVITDVCICGYTSHGHCGVLNGESIDNDASLPILAKMALSHARAGADMVAPSAMMDGQVQAIRQLLDQHGLSRTAVLAYSAKYASGFYGPFRDAAQSAPSFGDRKAYQMDFRTIRQGTDEVLADLDEGAAWVMVKPAHAYLDVIARAKAARPEAVMTAYQVSGEYMMVKSAAAQGFLDEHNAMNEVLTAIKRAGSNYIITYYAKDWALRSC